jgi:antirestriction protein ArdC
MSKRKGMQNKEKGVRTSQKEKLEQLVEVLKEGVKNFSYTPEEFKAILEMKALMPSYSFRNLMVAKAQLPTASYIAPLKRWNELGRKVKKGEKAIRIFAPRFVRVEQNNQIEEEINEQEEYKLVGFITVPVFDYSQTEGEPLPIDKVKIQLEGDCPEAREIISLAEKLAEMDHCRVSYGDTGPHNGYYNKVDHCIVVSEKLSINHRCKTLVHELVHSKVHRYDYHSSAKEKEIVAEGAAFVICNYFGLDTSDYSFHYVYSWSQGDDEALMKYGTQICDIAGRIINEFQEIKNNILAKTA